MSSTEKRLLNIAHRGFSSAFPENTLLAFDEGMKAGADGFECDLRLSADGHVVVFHDDDLVRLCGRLGSIEKLTWKEIQTLKVKNKAPIPSLEQLLTDFHTTRINLEIKRSDREPVLVEAVLRELTKIRPKGKILFSSFSASILRCLRLMDAEGKLGDLGILVEKEEINELAALTQELRPATWNVPKQILDANLKGLGGSLKLPPLWVWTLEDPGLWKRVLDSDLPFEAIITNRPDALKAFLDAEMADK